MTYREICARLAEAGVPDPATDAQILMEEALGLTPAALMLRREEDFTSPRLEETVARRAGREPLQYILGRWSFMGFDFEVSPDCLIPRADTELLCETALRALPKNGVFADLCTGSGCIALSILALRADLRAVAVDISPEALAVARRNAERLGVSDRVTFLLHDVTEPLPGEEIYDLIVTNPPYVPTADTKVLEPELYHEPMLALDGGMDGLDLYRRIAAEAGEHLNPGGYLYLEVGIGEAEPVLELVTHHIECAQAGVFNDLNGIPRIVWARSV